MNVKTIIENKSNTNDRLQVSILLIRTLREDLLRAEKDLTIVKGKLDESRRDLKEAREHLEEYGYGTCRGCGLWKNYPMGTCDKCADKYCSKCVYFQKVERWDGSKYWCARCIKNDD